MISKRTEEAEVPAREAEARGAGRKPRTNRGGAELGTATSGRTKSEDHQLMEAGGRTQQHEAGVPAGGREQGCAGRR